MGTADPVSDPAGYQALLLSKLGGDDPAEVQAATPDLLARLVTDAGADLRTPPEHGEWSVLEAFAHIAHAEIVVSARYRWILAHDEPPLVPYDQARWVDRLRSRDDDPRELLEVFAALRRANLGLWARTSDEERRRVGLHEERGPESLDLSFRLIAGHDRLHHAQGRAALERVRRRSAEA
jgi:hypothetical protein